VSKGEAELSNGQGQASEGDPFRQLGYSCPYRLNLRIALRAHFGSTGAVAIGSAPQKAKVYTNAFGGLCGGRKLGGVPMFV
jgi:hypothetical protein